MSETLTLGKSRKSGEWVVLVQPEKQFGVHLDAYRKIAVASPVSDEYERVVIGKLRHTSPALNLITSKQQKDAKQAEQKRNDSIDEIVRSAPERQKKMADDNAAKLKKEHEEKIAAKNLLIAGIRKDTNQPITEPTEAPKAKVESGKQPESESTNQPITEPTEAPKGDVESESTNQPTE